MAISSTGDSVFSGLSDTIVLEAKGEHKVTVVFLHGLASSGERYVQPCSDYSMILLIQVLHCTDD